MVAEARSLRSVLVPTEMDGELLLPNANVAEVTALPPVESVAGAPDWLLGQVDWRGVVLPVLSVSAFAGKGREPLSPTARLVVLYALGELFERGYLGILSPGMPRLIRLDRHSLQGGDEAEEQRPGVLRSINVYGESAWIPDLDALETAASEALTRASV